MPDPLPPGTKSGWYPDPDNPDRERYWSKRKNAWTARVSQPIPQKQARTASPPPGWHTSSSRTSPPDDERAEAASTAHRNARLVERLATAYAFFGVIGAIAIGAMSAHGDCTTDSLGDASCTTTHPYVALGIGVGLGVLFTAALAALLGSYVRFRVLDTGWRPE